MKIGKLETLVIFSALIGGATGGFSGLCVGALIGFGLCVLALILKGIFKFIIKYINYKEE